MKKPMFAVVLVFALLVTAVPFMSAAAQSERTLSFSEEQVNSTFWVTNPRNRHISDVLVDLQPGQVTISAIYTKRLNRTGTQTEQHSLSVTMTPSIANGRVNWTVTAAMGDSQPASGDLLAQINAHLASSWRRWISNTRPTGRITGVTITDDAITYSFQ